MKAILLSNASIQLRIEDSPLFLTQVQDHDVLDSARQLQRTEELLFQFGRIALLARTVSLRTRKKESRTG